jgi:hypothetical protein
MMIVATRMLNPASPQVNGHVVLSSTGPMNQSNIDNTTARPAANLLLESLLTATLARLVPQRLLVISADPGSMPAIDRQTSGCVATIETAGLTGMASLQCSSELLPFEDGSFNMLIMHHILGDGGEPQLAEAQRVLTGNGQLMVIGRSRFGMRPDNRTSDIPALDVRSVCRNLKRRAFLIRQCEGLGFRGRRVHLQKSWQQLALPFSDLVLIRGRHTRLKPVATPLKFTQPQVAGVRSAALDGLSREAVQGQ